MDVVKCPWPWKLLPQPRPMHTRNQALHWTAAVEAPHHHARASHFSQMYRLLPLEGAPTDRLHKKLVNHTATRPSKIYLPNPSNLFCSHRQQATVMRRSPPCSAGGVRTAGDSCLFVVRSLSLNALGSARKFMVRMVMYGESRRDSLSFDLSFNFKYRAFARHKRLVHSVHGIGGQLLALEYLSQLNITLVKALHLVQGQVESEHLPLWNKARITST